MTRSLAEARLAFQPCGDVLALPAERGRMPQIKAALSEHLSPFTQASVQAVRFQGDLACAQSVMAAFVRAEPLPILLERMEYEWVREALDDNWLFSVFHPIVEARSGQVHAHEALIRACHPQTQAVIGAGPIIEACEHLHLQHVLDQRARQTAIRDAAALGLTNNLVFINFLPNTIYDPEICLRTTMEAAAEHQVDVSRLVFEVVETEDIPDMDRLKRILDYYRARGVGTAVDDMGAGFSTMQYLTHLRPDYVKLDRALVVEAARGGAARDKMDAVVRAAHDMNIQVIAEGIETHEQRAACCESGIDYMQGFLFARPASPPETVRASRWEPLRAAA